MGRRVFKGLRLLILRLFHQRPGRIDLQVWIAIRVITRVVVHDDGAVRSRPRLAVLRGQFVRRATAVFPRADLSHNVRLVLGLAVQVRRVLPIRRMLRVVGGAG